MNVHNGGGEVEARAVRGGGGGEDYLYHSLTLIPQDRVFPETRSSVAHGTRSPSFWLDRLAGHQTLTTPNAGVIDTHSHVPIFIWVFGI